MKIFIFFIFVLKSSITYADITLDCKSTRYDLTPDYNNSWAESWVPKNHKHIIEGNKSVYNFNFSNVKVGNVFVDNETELKIKYRWKHKSQNYTELIFLYFKTNKKFNIEWRLPGGYINAGSVWGKCEEKINAKKNKNENSLNLSDLCEKATISGKSFKWKKPEYEKAVNTAKNKGLTPEKCGEIIISQLSDYKICKYSTKLINNEKIWDKNFPIHYKIAMNRKLNCGVKISITEDPKKTVEGTGFISNKMKPAEDKCLEIGFKKGTEKYGECVLKIIELK